MRQVVATIVIAGGFECEKGIIGGKVVSRGRVASSWVTWLQMVTNGYSAVRAVARGGDGLDKHWHTSEACDMTERSQQEAGSGISR